MTLCLSPPVCVRSRHLSSCVAASEPNLDEWVFCRVLDDTIGDFLPEDEPSAEPINMSKGDAFVLKYKTIHDLVKTGSVALS